MPPNAKAFLKKLRYPLYHLDFETFLKDNFPDWKIQYYDEREDGFKAVSAGEADCVLINNYRLNRVKDQCEKYGLSPLATGCDADFSFAVRRDDDCLYSILNKISRLIPESLIHSSLTANSYSNERVTFSSFLRDNMAGVFASVTGLALLIIALLLRVIRTERRENQERKLISAV